MPTARMFAFHGGKSGEGKTFLAQNLGAALAERGSVLLLDLDPQARREIGLRWNLPPAPGLAELAGQWSRFDPQTLRGYFPGPRPGLEVADLGTTPAEAAGISSTQILRALELFSQTYDFILADGLMGWEPLVLEILDRSERVLAPVAAELPGLRQLARDIEQYQKLKFPAGKPALLLNRAGTPGTLRPADVESALPGYAVFASFPYEPRALEAANQQRDLFGLYPRSDFSKHLRKAAGQLSEMPRRPERIYAGSGAEAVLTSAAGLDSRAVKESIHAQLLENEELKQLMLETGRHPAGKALVREKVEAVVSNLMALAAPTLLDREQRERLVRDVVDEALGLGPLEDLMRDPEISEIMVNRCDQIYLERDGKLEASPKHFISDQQLRTVIERIVAPLGRRIDESQPYVDARLPDGSRVNAVIPPLALKGPTLTIRKFSRRRLGVRELVRMGSLPGEWADFLGACVRGRKNLIISGGTGSGKTTLLNGLAAFIPETERIITVEDAAELSLPQPHVVTLESRPANLEGKGAVTIRQLVRNCLRMRPDRIVVGECRGEEALDMLWAMSTGHEGSLTTVHANTPQDAVARLETMVLMSGVDMPVRAIREQIASAIHLVVQQSRLQDGTRKIIRIAEVAGLEDGQVKLQDIFVFKQTGVDASGKALGEWKTTGYVPALAEGLEARGIPLERGWFKKK